MRDDAVTSIAQRIRDPRIVIGIIYPTGSIYLTNRTGIANVPGNVVDGVLGEISSTSQSIYPDEGRSTIGSLAFTAVDLGSAITDEIRDQLINQSRGIRRREVRVYTGDTDDFLELVRVETYVIDAVVELAGRSYRFQCSDRQRELRQDCFVQVGTRLDASYSPGNSVVTVQSTDGFEMVAHTAAFTDAPSSTVGYFTIRKTGEVIRYTGKTATTFTGCTGERFGTIAQAVEVDAGTAADRRPEIEEFIYLEMPGPQLLYAVMTGKILGTSDTLPATWNLGIAEAHVDSDQFDSIGADLYDPNDDTLGLVLRFTHLEKVDGKRFCNEQLHVPMGSFFRVGADGRLGIKRMTPLIANASPVVVIGPEGVCKNGLRSIRHVQNKVINEIVFDWNYDGDAYTRTEVFFNAESILAHGLAKPKTLELGGLHVSRHSRQTLQRIADALAERYGAPPIEIEVKLSRALNHLEVGDVVGLSLDRVQDYTAAGSLDRSFEIQSRRINWRTGDLSVSLFGSTSRTSPNAGAGSGAVLDDDFYDDVGTELSTVLTISAGHVTANGSLTGAADVRAAVYYFLGDLTIDAGVTITISDNVALFVRGELTVNGTIDGAAQGLSGLSDPNTVTNAALASPSVRGGGIGQSYGGGVTDFLTNVNVFRGRPPPQSYGNAQVLPRLNLAVESGGLVGLPADVRGAPGGFGGYVATAGVVGALGGDGGDGGAGLVILCRGLSFGASAEIDLSGTDGALGGSASISGITMHAGGGGGGTPGGLYVLLDGDDIPLPDLTDSLIVNQGATPAAAATRLPSSYAYISTATNPARPYHLGLSAVDRYTVNHVVQYVPSDIELGASDDEVVPPPTDLTASVDDIGVTLRWASPPVALHDYVEAWMATTNDRTGATLQSARRSSSIYIASDSAITRYFWIRAVKESGGARGYSAWEPVGETAGISATFGGGAVDPSTFIYRQASAPGTPDTGTIWIDTDDSRVYRFNGSTWDQFAVDDALLLTSNAPAEGGADVTAANADSVIYRQASAPSSPSTGWIWYDTDDGRFYRFNGSTWDQIAADDPTLSSFNAAAEAGADQTSGNTAAGIAGQGSLATQDPADIIHRQASAPSSPSTGWIWYDTDDGRFYRFNGAAWEQIAADDPTLSSFNAAAEAGADQTSSNTAANIAGQGTLATQNPADLIYRQASAPAHEAGRIWYDTDDGRFYRSNGSTWEQIGADDPTLASNNAAAEGGADVTANSTDDIVYRQSTAPTGVTAGTLWVDTDDARVYRYNGSTWDQIGSNDLALIGGLVGASQISVANIAAINANLGTITAGILNLAGAGSHLNLGGVSYDSGTGILLEYNGGTPRAFLGNSGANKLLWTGSALQITGDLQFTNASGSFAPAYTGFSVSPTGNWLYMDFGTYVLLWVGASGYAQGTSNSTSFTITNLPAAIRPAAISWVPVAAVGNSAQTQSIAAIQTGGGITFLADGGTWTASGNKALVQGAAMMYPL